MAAALNAKAGRMMLLGRPRPSAAKYTVPMIAARIADGGAPLISTYIQIRAKGNSR